MSRQKSAVKTAFWDTSAVVPLCCYQSSSTKARQAARTFARQVVWWITPIEAISAFQRLIRENNISPQEAIQCQMRLSYLRDRWNEIQPREEIRNQAERLLRMHRLQAADSLQLAAALAWCNNRPRGQSFIVSDGVLAAAAQMEGFDVHLI